MKNGVLGTYSQSPCENPVSKDVAVYTSLSLGSSWLAGCPLGICIEPWELFLVAAWNL